MPVSSVWVLDESQISISGGGVLDGVTQGNGSHLMGLTLTLNAPAWQETFVDDNDAGFDDNDAGQTLSGAQTIGGVTYASGTRVEAEYRLTLRDPATGQTWDVIGYNINNTNPSFGTIEALAFIGPPGGWPPVGIALEVMAAFEGPGFQGQATTDYQNYVTPPCFVPGTRIDTLRGPVAVQDLRPGDLILTADAGPQPLRLLARSHLTAARLRAEPWLLPVRVDKGLVVSPRHRVLLQGAPCELHFGAPEVLVAASDLAGSQRLSTQDLPFGVSYLHLVLDRHHIIRAGGRATESLQVGPLVHAGAPPCIQAELQAIFPGLGRPGGTPWQTGARPLVTPREARLLRAA